MHEALVDAAFEYAYPLYAVAQTRWNALHDAANPERHAPNTLQHQRALSDHRSRWLTAPNNDTLYSNAWLDLSHGPVTVRVDRMPEGRYWSLAFMDAWTDHIAMAGQRLDGTGPVDITLLGPAWHEAPANGRVVRAEGDHVWLFVRCLVDGPDDLPQSHAMQARIRVEGPQGVSWPEPVRPVDSRDPANFLAVVNESLASNPPPASEAGLLASFAAVGLRPGAVDAWREMPEDARAAWSARIGPAHEKLRTAGRNGRREVQGWFAAAAEMGQFGSHYALRASVALGGLGALEPAEAMYFVRFHGVEGELLDGTRGYVMRVPPEGIPTDSFWSFSMYEPTADGQRFFAANPIHRYSIGNRTPGLVYNADGSLDIALQHTEPTDPTLRANWLPAPAGTFQISLRTYLPRRELQEVTARMPQILPA